MLGLSALSARRAATTSPIDLFVKTEMFTTTTTSSTSLSLNRRDANSGTSNAGLTASICTRGHQSERFLLTVTVPKGLAIVPAGAGAFPPLELFHVVSPFVRKYATR